MWIYHRAAVSRNAGLSVPRLCSMPQLASSNAGPTRFSLAWHIQTFELHHERGPRRINSAAGLALHEAARMPVMFQDTCDGNDIAVEPSRRLSPMSCDY